MDDRRSRAFGVLAIKALYRRVLAGDGSFYYFKVPKPKQTQDGSILNEPEELDFDDDNNEAFDTEIKDIGKCKMVYGEG